eukprot:CAMPEP_0198307212 /NCGR_PEP_ID=MMETSP1450-20131203/129_1 /TAXON_ID=753684 ORGANISM="Madagascaria erythrocladiodes, Strain CCMP3234" /NCGR_SAMPLE_ID=MMETSP1450 /ASSEMBLY_ACC=CAM_ASM_001115 /LENGTH=128 /DNA_ID=CAMNT_0044009777 /DNA_START=122 /DNA_END=505 /DNA_ORIENTATION=+
MRHTRVRHPLATTTIRRGCISTTSAGATAVVIVGNLTAVAVLAQPHTQRRRLRPPFAAQAAATNALLPPPPWLTLALLLLPPTGIYTVPPRHGRSRSRRKLGAGAVRVAPSLGSWLVSTVRCLALPSQ